MQRKIALSEGQGLWVLCMSYSTEIGEQRTREGAE